MDYFELIWKIGCALGPFIIVLAKYDTDLQSNLQRLCNSKDALRCLRQETTRRVESEERRQKRRRIESVDNWLGKADGLEREVEFILQNGEHELQKTFLLKCLPWNFYSSYRLRETVITKSKDVKNAINDGNFEDATYQLPRASVVEMPVENATVGLDSLLEEVWGYLHDRSVGIIGLYGQGGVGKTTLLKKINNEFLKKPHNFDVTIWVMASKEVNMEKILEVIRKQIDISDSEWPSESETQERRATKILEVLRTKKFMLMIDDIWERIDLMSMGIPLPDHQNESKVVFTSRSRDVCGLMEAQRRIKVGCLAREEAINLFLMKVGEETLKSHPEILKLAKVVAEECEGLPLALVTIGLAMRSRKTPGEWVHAISVLQSYPSEFSGIGDQVFPVLRFSYDSLPCERDRKCFLYISILREGYNIRKDELINIWIGEGLLDERRNIHEAYNLGEHVVGTLKLACLLESDESEEFVRMHDMIRDMALWIANTGGRERYKILVQHARSTEAPKFEILDETERVSVWGHHDNIESFIGSEPHCPNLLSLFVKDGMLNSFSNGFFQYMQALKVLDLSGNRRLTKLPESIGELINLQYLNLSETGIVELPLELGKLKKLKSLLLNYTKDLRKIPTEVISSLLCLQVFSMVSDEFSPRAIQTAFYVEQALLVELERLDDLGDLRITISLASGAKKVFESPKLQKCIKMLSFNRTFDSECFTVSSSSLEIMNNLVKLQIMYCKSLRRFEISENTSSARRHCFPCLSEVVIWGCDLQHATWLIYAPHLQKLTIADCQNMEEVIGETGGVFSSLQTLHLQSLPSLKIICPRALLFPALIEIHVDQCDRLGNLPLNATSASGLKQIKGTASWWNWLEWEDKAIEDTFKSKFIEIPDYK